MKTIKTIILDFDGVIVESDNIKHQAFSEIFSAYPQYYEKIMQYHYSNNAVDRYSKFRHIMSGIMNTGYDPDVFSKWSAEFRKLTVEKIISCPYVSGAEDFLQYFSEVTGLHIASATPPDDLLLILKERGLLNYFSSINGSDRKKTEIMKNISESIKLQPDEMLYIGDSREDLITAENFGCEFIGRQRKFDFNSAGIISFTDLFRIKEYILEKYIIETV